MVDQIVRCCKCENTTSEKYKAFSGQVYDGKWYCWKCLALFLLKKLDYIEKRATKLELELKGEEKEYYSSGQVAKILDIPDRTVRRYLSERRLKGHQNIITGTWSITKKAVRNFVREQSGLSLEEYRRCLLDKDILLK